MANPMSDSLNRREFAAALLAPVLLPLPRLRKTVAAPVVLPPSAAFLNELPRLMELAQVPGIGMGIVHEDRVAWQNHAGVMDATSKQPVTAGTIWPAASLSKPVFAYGVLSLVDEGKLDLDRPLNSYVEGHAPADARGDKITPRHVLSHTTGYVNWRNRPEMALTPSFEPGARFQYSGEGFYYLQRAVEKVTGNGFEQFMQERVFGPLGMRSSTYFWREDAATRLVSGHNRGTPTPPFVRDFSTRLFAVAAGSKKPLSQWTHEDIVAAMAKMSPAPPMLPNFIVPNAAGSLITTVADYSAFLIRLMSDSTGLRPATRQAMAAPQSNINSALNWGLGWGLEKDHGRDYLWHWGDNGAWKAFVLAHPQSRSAIVIFTNGSNGLRLIERVLMATTGHAHVAFLWI
jgi:CubicO group peptidase (beta-lactamase class C family)